ncbi:MAG: tetratricopeptide repeat protein [Victivallaceae bacterium]|nr:tetratricopeptide repeat protein [Victivallaceae bacterium]
MLYKKKLLFLVALFFLMVPALDAKNSYRNSIQEAQKSYQAQKYELALEQYRMALDLSPNGWNDTSCMAMIGNSLAALKRYDEALKWFELIGELPDINQNTRVRRFDYAGDLYFYRLKDYPKALENYQTCLEQTSDFRHWAALQEKMARVFLAMKKRQEAVHYFKSAILCQDPYYYAAASARRQLAGLLLGERKYDDVIELLREVDLTKYRQHERNAAAGYGGIAAFRKKNYELALKFLTAIEQNTNIKLLYSGQSYLALDQHDKAITALTALRNNKRFAHRERGEAGMYIGDSYRKQKKFDDAAKAYKKAIAVTSDANLQKLLQDRINALKVTIKKNKK